MLQMIMLTHVRAKTIHKNIYIMDSGTEEHMSQDIGISTNMQLGTDVPLQTADGTPMLTHDSGTVHRLWQAVGCQHLSPPGLILNVEVLGDIATCDAHDAIIYTLRKVLLM